MAKPRSPRICQDTKRARRANHVIAGQVDVFPAQRRQVLQQLALSNLWLARRHLLTNAEEVRL